MAADAVSWLSFGGTVLMLMGANLAFDAEDRAKAIAEWEGSDPKALSRTTGTLRLAGAAISLAGLAVLTAKRFFPSWARPPLLNRPRDLAAGLLLAAVGGVLGLVKAARVKPSRLEKLLEPEAPSLSRRGADATAWLLVASFIAYGAFLAAG